MHFLNLKKNAFVDYKPQKNDKWKKKHNKQKEDFKEHSVPVTAPPFTVFVSWLRWWRIMPVFSNSPWTIKETRWWVRDVYRSHPVPPAVQRKTGKTLLGVADLQEALPSVLRAGKMTRSWQGFNSRVTKHVRVMAERLRSALSLTGSFLMLAASELWSTWYGAHTD